MRVSSLLALPLLSLLTFANAAPDNTTLGHRVARHNVGASNNNNNNQGGVDKSNWNKLKCSLVAGKYAGHSFNFGCLCLSDVDSFCMNNNVNDYIKSLLSSYIDSHGSSSLYPPNAQPTCYNGGYDCGSLSKKSDGTCGSTSCHPNTCSSNGGCCPRGQSYENGQCCARTGCSRQKTCTPILTCSKYTSNGICCADATSNDWVGQKTRCCPKTQVEISGQCTCPSGTTKSGSTCVSVCPSGQKWGGSLCCSLDSTEKNGKCVCNSDQQAYNPGNGKCENVCPGTQTFYPSVKICCPSGATFKNGVCDCGPQADLKGQGKDMVCKPKCDGNLVKVGDQCCPASVTRLVGGKCDCGSQADLKVSGSSLVCKPKCDNGFTYCTTKCCPSGATQVGNDCKCTTPGQTLTTVGGKSQCADMCTGGMKWCKTRCCPSYLQEDASGNCVCANEAYTPDSTRKQCVPKCTSSQKYNYGTHKCEAICDESAGYYYKQGFFGKSFCCRKSETACSTTCCPAGTVEIGTTGKCCKEGSTVVNGKCVEPTTKPKARSLAGRIFGKQLPIAPSPSAYGIEENRNGTLCPASLAACPIEGSEGLFECLDTSADLQSCGGCLALGHGKDCTTMPGARWMGCNSGQCEVYSCKKGWKRNANRSACNKVGQ